MLLSLAILGSLAFFVPSSAEACDGGYGGMAYYRGPGYYGAYRPSYDSLYRGRYGSYGGYGCGYGHGGYGCW